MASPETNRRRGLTAIGFIVVLGLIAYGVYWLLYLSHYESTDDAYVSGDVVAITSLENATVLAIHVDSTQGVKRGQLLIDLDPARANIEMANARAELARTVRDVKALFSRANELRALIRQREAEAQRAEA